jgi:hypothetical protein
MDLQSARVLVEDFTAAFNARDEAHLLQLVTPDFELRLPRGEPLRGPDGVRAWLSKAHDSTTPRSISIDRVFLHGGSIWALATMHMRWADGEGEGVDVPSGAELRVRDGLLAYVAILADRAAVAKLADVAGGSRSPG